MNAKKIEEEIKVINSVLCTLYKCLKLYREIGDIRQVREVRADITLVEKELCILIAEKDAEPVATKEP
jgi:hypothetical protein